MKKQGEMFNSLAAILITITGSLFSLVLLVRFFKPFLTGSKKDKRTLLWVFILVPLAAFLLFISLKPVHLAIIGIVLFLARYLWAKKKKISPK